MAEKLHNKIGLWSLCLGLLIVIVGGDFLSMSAVPFKVSLSSVLDFCLTSSFLWCVGTLLICYLGAQQSIKKALFIALIISVFRVLCICCWMMNPLFWGQVLEFDNLVPIFYIDYASLLILLIGSFSYIPASLKFLICLVGLYLFPSYRLGLAFLVKWFFSFIICIFYIEKVQNRVSKKDHHKKKSQLISDVFSFIVHSLAYGVLIMIFPLLPLMLLQNHQQSDLFYTLGILAVILLFVTIPVGIFFFLIRLWRFQKKNLNF